ncbi:MAG: hypothetical protein AB1646_20435 [Thermodesulfobacteriota bacterium]
MTGDAENNGPTIKGAASGHRFRRAAVGMVVGALLPFVVYAFRDSFRGVLPPEVLDDACYGLLVVSWVVFIWGLYHYVKGKGYSGALALVGVFHLLSVPYVATLPDRSKSQYSAPGLFTFLILVLCLLVVAAVKWPHYLSYTRKVCDECAQRDLESVREAFARVKKEATDMRLPWDTDSIAAIAAGHGLEYMVGPHYGWNGTDPKCRVLVRLASDKGAWIIQATSLEGSRPMGPASRYLYCVSAHDGAELAVQTMDKITVGEPVSSAWNGYPRTDSRGHALCYSGSIVENVGTAQHPRLGIKKPESGKCAGTP